MNSTTILKRLQKDFPDHQFTVRGCKGRSGGSYLSVDGKELETKFAMTIIKNDEGGIKADKLYEEIVLAVKRNFN